MDDDELRRSVSLLRDNLAQSATPNMQNAISGGAPIAALVYALALVDAMAGFFYGHEAKAKAERGDGVRLRYEEFTMRFLSPARSGCDYSNMDLYQSLRCNMAHSLTPGHSKRGKFEFVLVQACPAAHGAKKGHRSVVIDVPTLCDDFADAASRFLDQVEQAIGTTPRPKIIESFAAWWEQGYSVIVSG